MADPIQKRQTPVEPPVAQPEPPSPGPEPANAAAVEAEPDAGLARRRFFRQFAGELIQTAEIGRASCRERVYVLV